MTVRRETQLHQSEPRNRAASHVVRDLAARVGRLTVDRRDPERFHQEKSDLVDELRRLAHVLEGAGGG